MTFIDRPIINPEVKRHFLDVISNDMAGNVKQSFNDKNNIADFQRFTNRSDEGIKDKDSEATKKNTKQALDLLKEFCLAKELENVEEICSETGKTKLCPEVVLCQCQEKRWIVVQQE